jgi:hypothetical protein
MDDLKFGTRDKRGSWTPCRRRQIAPLWDGKWGQMGRYLIDYVWPRNAYHIATTHLCCVFVIPDVAGEGGKRPFAARSPTVQVFSFVCGPSAATAGEG